MVDLYSMKRVLQILITIIILSNWNSNIYAQCSISDYNVTYSECYASNTVDIIIDFESDSPSQAGYIATVNGGSLGVFQFDDLPFVASNFEGNCVSDYDVAVFDLADQECSASENLGIICCDIACDVIVLDAQFNCINSDSISINTKVQLVGSTSDSLFVYVNGGLLNTFDIDAINNDGIVIPTIGQLQTLTICEQENICCTTIEIIDPCICNISQVSASILDCNDDSTEYYLRVDLEITDFVSDSFTLGIPGNNLGNHAYDDLPISVGPISFDDNGEEIFVLDLANSLCFDFVELVEVDDCESVSCALSNLEILPLECNHEGMSMLEVSFNTVKESEGFEILINGILIGNYNYGLSRYIVGPVDADCATSYEITIVDLEESSCQVSKLISPICCDCSIENLQVTQFCNGGSLDSLTINFNTNGVLSDSFLLTANSESNAYAYNQLPIKISTLSDTIDLSVDDINFPQCNNFTTIISECISPCMLFDLDINIENCIAPNLADFVISFNHEGLLNDTIIVGMSDAEIGRIVVNENNSYTLIDIEFECNPEGSDFTISAANDSNCSANYVFTECCLPCNISEVVTDITCLDNFMTEINLDLEYDGDSTDILEFMVDGILIDSASYFTLPQVYSLPNLTDGEHFIEIIFPLCIYSETIDVDCTDECIVENLTVDTLGCTEGMFSVEIDFDHSEANDSFLILVNEANEGVFRLDDLPINIGPYSGDGTTEYEFTVSVFTLESCIEINNIGVIECTDVNVIDPVFSSVNWWSTVDGISLSGLENIKALRVYDVTGRKLYSQVVNHETVDIKLDTQINSIYLIQLISTEGKIRVIKAFR